MAKMTSKEMLSALRPLGVQYQAYKQLEEILQAAVSIDEAVVESRKSLDALVKEAAKAKSAIESEDRRATQAKQATDDIVKTCRELADKAQAEKAEAEKALAQRMHEIQMEQGKHRAELDAELNKYLAEMNAAKAAAKKAYDEENVKLMADLASKAARIKQLQADIDALKAKYA